MGNMSKVLITAAVVAAAGGAYGAFWLLGWIGVGILGLSIAFIAVQAEMDDAAPIGGQQTSSLYASTFQAQEASGHAEKSARRAERKSTLRNLNLAKAIGGALSLIGLLGFFFKQLPH